MSEFALVMPILVLLMAGMIMAGMYAFRAAAADWGVFITGVAAGPPIVWPRRMFCGLTSVNGSPRVPMHRAACGPQ